MLSVLSLLDRVLIVDYSAKFSSTDTPLTIRQTCFQLTNGVFVGLPLPACDTLERL